MSICFPVWEFMIPLFQDEKPQLWGRGSRPKAGAGLWAHSFPLSRPAAHAAMQLLVGGWLDGKPPQVRSQLLTVSLVWSVEKWPQSCPRPNFGKLRLC